MKDSILNQFRWYKRHFLPFKDFTAIFSYFSILQDSMATTYEDEGPIPWFRTEQCIFYIVFFVVFPFFFVNIFVALIIVTFNELGEAELEDDMDKNQKSCIDFAIQVLKRQNKLTFNAGTLLKQFWHKLNFVLRWFNFVFHHRQSRWNCMFQLRQRE